MPHPCKACQGGNQMRKSTAFTLIEFLVVIVIIACLLFPVKRKQAKKSRITACASLRSYLCRRGLCPPAPRKKHRFILIELLVAIAIIAILAPMLLPTAVNSSNSRSSSAERSTWNSCSTGTADCAGTGGVDFSSGSGFRTGRGKRRSPAAATATISHWFPGATTSPTV